MPPEAGEGCRAEPEARTPEAGEAGRAAEARPGGADDLSARALQAAVGLARELGISAGEPVVLAVRSNVVVRLADGGPVARIGGLTAQARDVREHFARELVLTRHLCERGAPAVRPCEPAGPHERDGFVLTLWEEVPDGPPADGAQAGRALRTCHEALRDLRGAELPPVTTLLDEARALVDRTRLERRDRLLLRGHLMRATAEVLAAGLPSQPLHGDTGPGNVLPGAIWNDWEDCCRGPVAWDLGCLVSTPRILGTECARAEEALAAYGPFDGDLDVFVHARAAQTAAWSAFTVATGGGDPARTERRLSWLRDR